jgi:hypothetical protein
MTDTQKRVAIGAAVAGAAAVVTYLLGQGVITTELAVGVNAILGFIGGYAK